MTTRGDRGVSPPADDVLSVPPANWVLQPILAVIRLQPLAYTYGIARLPGATWTSRGS